MFGNKHNNNNNRLVWREIGPLAIDPHQPYNQRLVLQACAGFGLATGVRFRFDENYEGMVVYLARETVDRSKLESTENEAHLKASARHIGSVLAMQEHRRAAMSARKQELAQTMRKTKNTLLLLHRGRDLEEIAENVTLSSYESMTNSTSAPSLQLDSSDDEEQEEKEHHRSRPLEHEKQPLLRSKHRRSVAKTTRRPSSSIFRTVAKKSFFQMFERKPRVSVAPPPPQPLGHALWTFAGAFITLSALTEYSRHRGGLVLPPFGALAGLQFDLIAAPPAQPRNILCGQLIGLTISMTAGFLLEGEYAWIRTALAPALAIFLMSKLGVVHPPAGAAAMIFSSGKHGLEDVWALMVANVIAIVCATVVNNLSSNRQYPTFWGLVPCCFT